MKGILPGARVVHLPRKPKAKKIVAQWGIVMEIDPVNKEAYVWYDKDRRLKRKPTKVDDLLLIGNITIEVVHPLIKT